LNSQSRARKGEAVTWRRKCLPLWPGIGYKVFYSSLRLEVTKFLCKLLAEAVLSGDGVILWSERSWFQHERNMAA
jgi:hypothetical protein